MIWAKVERMWARGGLSLLLVLAIALPLLGLAGCSLPQVQAEDRIFLNLALDYLGTYRLPPLESSGTPVGEIAALAYDRQQDLFYALARDATQPRFSTLKFTLAAAPIAAASSAPEPLPVQQVELQRLTLLQTPQGEPLPPHQFTPAGIAIAPDQSVFITSRGSATAPTQIGQFQPDTGREKRLLTLPTYFLPTPTEAEAPQGTPPGLGLAALTLNPTGDRLFSVAEVPLLQDQNPATPDQWPSRLLHYLISDPADILIAVHLYPLGNPAATAAPAPSHVLALKAIDNGGHFLSLEQSWSPEGATAQIFQIATGGATDISRLPSLAPNLTGIVPIRKRLLLNLQDVGIPLAHLESMELGPRFPDGSQSLFLVSHNQSAAPGQTQLLLFRLQQRPQFAAAAPES